MGRQLCVRGCGFTRGRGAASDRRGRGACDKCEWWQREGAGKCARESWCALRLGGTRVCVATVVGVPAGDRVRSGRRVGGGRGGGWREASGALWASVGGLWGRQRSMRAIPLGARPNPTSSTPPPRAGKSVGTTPHPPHPRGVRTRGLAATPAREPGGRSSRRGGVAAENARSRAAPASGEWAGGLLLALRGVLDRATTPTHGPTPRPPTARRRIPFAAWQARSAFFLQLAGGTQTRGEGLPPPLCGAYPGGCRGC